VAAIRSRAHLPIVVGGSGLYVRALLDQLEIPPTDPAVRAWWEAELERVGVEELFARLTAADPEAAARIEPRNGRRVVRALEVIELTGRPFSATLPRREYAVPTVQLGLAAERSVLAERVARRVDRMWAQGLVDEVQCLQGQGLRQGRTSSRAIGYAQVLAMLDGQLTQEEAREDTITATRRLVRRQGAWFAPDPRINWLPHDAPDLVEQAVAAVHARALA
jgi:tRNA dimethylallyltransferase